MTRGSTDWTRFQRVTRGSTDWIRLQTMTRGRNTATPPHRLPKIPSKTKKCQVSRPIKDAITERETEVCSRSRPPRIQTACLPIPSSSKRETELCSRSCHPRQQNRDNPCFVEQDIVMFHHRICDRIRWRRFWRWSNQARIARNVE